MSDVIKVGWREFCALPTLHIPAIKAKIDTGARTSALHTASVTPYQKNDKEYVKFIVHPVQRNKSIEIECHSEVIDHRWIRNSGGEQELRYVINVEAQLGEQCHIIELTLANREDMRFRMLLGREALKPFHAVVDPSQSFCINRYSNAQVRSFYQSLGFQGT